MTGPDQRSTALAVRPKPRRRAIRLGLTQRGRLRRQVRFLRKQRELQMRDLGGLIFDMYRFGSKRQDLVREKLRLMFEADRELRAFEAMLGGRRGPLAVREPGVGGSCPRCLTLYSTDAHYCWRCGLALTEQAEAEAGQVVDLDDLDAHEPAAAEAPAAPQDTVETDALAPDEPETDDEVTAGPTPNGTAGEDLTTEIEAGRLPSRSADASRS
ncbi:MAG: hypothetical protein QOH11_3264 [Solirubrobacteraceae bacterium]|jgi:hypothetical protein|nr:hypothetical protein [Solirubrobacteraceae bacterium]